MSGTCVLSTHTGYDFERQSNESRSMWSGLLSCLLPSDATIVSKQLIHVKELEFMVVAGNQTER